MLYKNILKTINNTPLIKLNINNFNPKINIYGKLEGQNPGGSIKDRVALYMIKQAEKKKIINKNKTILEATSGNMGIALAMVGAVKGYKVTIIMSKAMSIERRNIIKNFGARLILTNKNYGTQGAIKKAKELIANNPDKYWFVDQFNNPDNPQAHYKLTAPEIFNSIKKIDYIIAGIGTTGTIMGIAKYFKKYSPQTKIIAVVPPAGYKIQGLQNPTKDFSGTIYNYKLIHKNINVSYNQTISTLKYISKTQGLMPGFSSGAAIHAAIQQAKNIKSGNIVVLLPDRIEKYLSLHI